MIELRGDPPSPLLGRVRLTDDASTAPRLVSVPAPGTPRRLSHEGDVVLAASSSAHDAQRGLWVVADARLDDRAALTAALGADPRQADDAELILQAYVHWGERAPERLLGAFAFAVWDERRRTLLCARDLMGLRSLHLWHGEDEVVFATWPETVAEQAGLPRVADKEALAALAARHYPMLLERSLLAGVRKLAPGELLLVSPARPPQRRPWWVPRASPPLVLPRAIDYADALREAVRVAVADAVRDPARYGAHLSGGIDSSSLAVLAQRELRARGEALRGAFSWSPAPDGELGPGDERLRVLAVARDLGVDVTFADVLEADRELMARWHEELVATETLLRELSIQRAARNLGVTVMLSGWGGDELASFNGRGHLALLAARGRWPAIVRHLSRSSRRGGSNPRRVIRAALTELRTGLEPLLPAAVRDRRAAAQPSEQPGADDPWVEHLRRDRQARGRDRVGGRETQLALLRLGHLTARVEAWARAGATVGIEYRYPLLDRRVLELCLAFPEDLWLREGFTRWVYRAAVEPLLPRELTWGVPKHEPGLRGARASRSS